MTIEMSKKEKASKQVVLQEVEGNYSKGLELPLKKRVRFRDWIVDEDNKIWNLVDEIREPYYARDQPEDPIENTRFEINRNVLLALFRL